MPETAAVRQLHDAPAVKVVASAYSIVVGLTNDRQITFQSGYEADESDEVVFARLQRNMRFADRLKANYELPTIEEELAKHVETLERFEDDMRRVENNHEIAQAKRQVELDEHMNLGAQEWEKSGKRGEYVPAGARARSIVLLKEALAKADAERSQNLEGLEISIKRYKEAIADYEVKLAKAKATAEG